MVRKKEFRKIDGYRYQIMSNRDESKNSASEIADAYRNHRRKIDGRNAKSVRVIKTSRGYAVYVR